MSILYNAGDQPGFALGANLTLVDTTVDRNRFGTVVTRTWAGTQTAVLQAIKTLSRDQTYRIDTSNAPEWRLIIRTGDDDTESQSTEESYHWEAPGQELAKSIYEHPNVLRGASEEDVRSLRKWIEDPPPDTSPPITSWTAAMQAVYYLAIRGQLQYLTASYSIALIKFVGSRYARQTTDVGVLKLYTTEELISENEADAPLPERLKFKLRAIPAPGAPELSVRKDRRPFFLWSWLKKPGTETQMGRKIQIRTEWTLDMWCTFLYPPLNWPSE